jgi:hypothetical protein
MNRVFSWICSMYWKNWIDLCCSIIIVSDKCCLSLPVGPHTVIIKPIQLSAQVHSRIATGSDKQYLLYKKGPCITLICSFHHFCYCIILFFLPPPWKYGNWSWEVLVSLIGWDKLGVLCYRGEYHHSGNWDNMKINTAFCWWGNSKLGAFSYWFRQG